MKVLALLLVAGAVLVSAGFPADNVIPSDVDEVEYDYIVVGGGSSGATVAGRLAETKDRKVLLLEAGPDVRGADLPEIMRKPNPSYAAFRPEAKKFRWENIFVKRTSEQTNVQWIKGKGVGGTSLINGQIAIRGRPEDYDGWKVEGWNYKGVLPFFKKMEHDFKFGDRPYHGDSGPTPITRLEQDSWGPIDRAHRDGSLSLGIDWAEDNNSPEFVEGVSYSAINSDAGRRVTTMDSYVEPARQGKTKGRLDVRGDALVDRVLFNSANEAYAVVVKSGNSGNMRGSDGTIVKGREIILSAGVIHTPTILMRSGIGPAEHLKKLGVEVRHDNPHVGQGLHEHPLVSLLVQLKKEHVPTDPYARSTSITTRFSSGDQYGTDLGFLSMNQVGDPTAGPAPFGAVSALLFHPFSRGYVKLTSKDAEVEPEVDLGLLSDPRDLPRLRTAAKRLFDLVQQPSFQKISDGAVAPDGENMVPLEEMLKKTDDELDQWILRSASDGYHSTSTAAMGRVVDERLHVFGVKKLRVADASIMPEAPRANTHLACVMVGEKAADLIIQDNE